MFELSNESERESHSVVSDSLRPHELYRVHGILQARILVWVAFPFARGSFQPRDRTQVSHTAGRVFTIWATREAKHKLIIRCHWCDNDALQVLRLRGKKGKKKCHFMKTSKISFSKREALCGRERYITVMWQIKFWLFRGFRSEIWLYLTGV